MRLLIVNTLPKEAPAAQAAVEELRENVTELRVINAYEMELQPCVGCNACWLKTPGICSIKDGYDELLRAYLEYDAAVFICGTALNFVDHRMKNVIDRMLPLANMYIHIVDGQCRHLPRYDKRYRFGLLYDGQADRDYLNEWLARVALNLGGDSIGAFPVSQAKEVL